MTESKSALLSSFDIRHPQVVIIYEGNKTGITGRDLGVHANPWALSLYFHRLHWGSLLNITWLSGMGTHSFTHALWSNFPEILNRRQQNKNSYTHNEAVMATITAIEKAVACLEKEKAALCMIVIGRDAKDPQTLPLTEKLLLTWIHTMMWSRLQEEHTLII